jgi:hypothetical protein
MFSSLPQTPWTKNQGASFNNHPRTTKRRRKSSAREKRKSAALHVLMPHRSIFVFYQRMDSPINLNKPYLTGEVLSVSRGIKSPDPWGHQPSDRGNPVRAFVRSTTRIQDIFSHLHHVGGPAIHMPGTKEIWSSSPRAHRPPWCCKPATIVSLALTGLGFRV